ncbi:MAG: TIR domain-containing protein [Clostridia bacterium]|nr:TIR domain-containing protein [Clostridia bacterium]
MDNSYVFISYAHRDSEAVLPCVQTMKQDGIHLWYDEGIEAGSEWPEFIAQKVIGCSKFVLFVSQAYLESQNCKRELNFAISRKKEILSVFLEDVSLSPGMEMQLGTYQAIYRKRYESMAAFHKAFCREHFFDSCRHGDTPPADGQEAPRGPEPGSGSTGASFTNNGQTSGTGSSPVRPNGSAPNNAYGNGFQPNGGQTGRQAPNGQNGGYGNGFQPNSGWAGRQAPSGQNGGYGNGFPPNNGMPMGNPYYTSAPPMPKKSRLTAFLLALLLGTFGIHKFYLRQTVWGVLYLVFCFTYIPSIVSIIEAFVILFSSEAKLMKTYKCNFS